MRKIHLIWQFIALQLVAVTCNIVVSKDDGVGFTHSKSSDRI